MSEKDLKENILLVIIHSFPRASYYKILQIMELIFKIPNFNIEFSQLISDGFIIEYDMGANEFSKHEISELGRKKMKDVSKEELVNKVLDMSGERGANFLSFMMKDRL